jgi:peptidoglycan/xylan/chitin deacetylase (PgdA/CDA1 family)
MEVQKWLLPIIDLCLPILPMQILVKSTGQKAIFPFYHIVADKTPIHVKHLYKAKSLKCFEKDLDFLLCHFDALDMSDVNQLIQTDKRRKRPGFFLTFDDGLREVYDDIAPMLLRKGIPAAFFVNSGFVDNKDLFYRYKASVLIEYFNNNPTLLQKEEVLVWQHKQNASNIIKSLLAQEYKDIEDINVLASAVGCDFGEYLSTIKPYMTQDQIKTLIRQGFYIGAHSIDHPRYHPLSIDQQVHQTIASCEWVTQTFDVGYRMFAFPFTDYGVGGDFFARIGENKHPLDISFGTAGLKNDPIQHHFQRTDIKHAAYSAETTIKTEYIYYLFKSILGKNTINRNDRN